jgi:arylsulfatase A-like enzyme
VDDAVGKLSAELSDNTLVVFMSDNGGPVGVNASRNDPFRGAKGQVYEGGIRVPFVVRWPARLTPGTCDAPVTCRDILPTALAAAGVAPPAGPDGTDLLPHLAGSPLPDRPLVWRMNGDKPWAVRRGSVKLVRPAAGPAELYDLAADPAEGTDLAASRPADVARLAADFAAWGGIARPPLWSNPAPAKK